MLRIKRGDTRPGASIVCKLDGVLIPWEDVLEARVLGQVNGVLVVNRAVTPTEPGLIPLDWLLTETATSGRMKLEVQIIWADGEKTTFPDDGYMEVDIIPDLGG